MKTLDPAVRTLRPALSFGNMSERRSAPRTDWRRWYRTARWSRLRMRVLVRDLFTCQMCGKGKSDTSKLVADHKTPHRGDPALFWDEHNIQTLCATPCHASVKQAEEAMTGGVW